MKIKRIKVSELKLGDTLKHDETGDVETVVKIDRGILPNQRIIKMSNGDVFIENTRSTIEVIE